MKLNPVLLCDSIKHRLKMQFAIIFVVGFCCGTLYAFPNWAPNVEPTCEHNGKPGVSVLDTWEHAANGEWGNYGRDVYDAFKGNQKFTGFDNPKPEPQEQPQQQPEPQQTESA